MNEQATRLKQDLQIVESAIGLDIWTLRDVRRAMLGCVAGGGAGLFLSIWNAKHGSEVAGLLIFLSLLATILLLKDAGYRKTPASPGTRREVGFYNRFYVVGSSLIGAYFIWGQKLGIDLSAHFASSVVMCGLWYMFYAISSPARSISLAGAVSLLVCGFALSAAKEFSEMLCWLGLATCIGCWLEAGLLFVGLKRSRDVAN